MKSVGMNLQVVRSTHTSRAILLNYASIGVYTNALPLCCLYALLACCVLAIYIRNAASIRRYAFKVKGAQLLVKEALRTYYSAYHTCTPNFYDEK